MRFQMIFSRKGTVTFQTLNFLRHLTMHSNQVPLKITFIIKKPCTKVTKLSLIFQQRSTLLTTGKTDLNAQGCRLWNLTVHIDLVSKRCIISVMRFRWWNSNQQCRIKSRRERPDLLFAMDRCIYCDVKVKLYTILCQVTWPTEVSRRRVRACLFIRLRTDTLGHAVLQHSLLQVGAQVVYLFKTWHFFSPKLEWCGDQRKVASYL